MMICNMMTFISPGSVTESIFLSRPPPSMVQASYSSSLMEPSAEM